MSSIQLSKCSFCEAKYSDENKPCSQNGVTICTRCFEAIYSRKEEVEEEEEWCEEHERVMYNKYGEKCAACLEEEEEEVCCERCGTECENDRWACGCDMCDKVICLDCCKGEKVWICTEGHSNEEVA